MTFVKSNKRLKTWWGILFLPVVLRSLIPIGFMPMVGPDSSVRLVLCEDYAPLPRESADMPAGMVMDGGVMGASRTHGGHAHGGSHGDHGGCPFGSSPALGALPSLAPESIAADRAVQPVAAAAQIEHFEVSFRAQSPRGPPV